MPPYDLRGFMNREEKEIFLGQLLGDVSGAALYYQGHRSNSDLKDCANVGWPYDVINRFIPSLHKSFSGPYLEQDAVRGTGIEVLGKVQQPPQP